MCRTVNQPSDWTIVTQGQEVLPAGIASIPGAEGGAGLVGEHHVVLGVVEGGLGEVVLFPC